MILHITDQVAWDEACRAGVYRPEGFAREGFIHCSTAAQVLLPADALFRGRTGLVLLLIDPARLEASLVYEDCEQSGRRFPHVYGPLNLGAVEQVVPFPCSEDGRFALPEVAAAATAVSVAPAVPADLVGLPAAVNETWPRLPESALRRKIDAQEVFLARQNRRVVGSAWLDRLWSKVPYLALIHVVRAYQRQGVGRSVLAWLEDRLRRSGETVLLSSSQVDESDPQAWHRRQGFVECGIITGVNAGQVGELFFRKAL